MTDKEQLQTHGAGVAHPAQAETPASMPGNTPRNHQPDQAPQVNAAALADLTTLAMQHPTYRNMAIADLEWLIFPPVITGNFAVLHATRPDGGKFPAAAITWARVSEEVDQRLMENLHRPFRLSPAEYVSGETHWLAHTFGPPHLVEQLLQAITSEARTDEKGNTIPAGPLAGRKLKRRVHGDSGQTMVIVVG